MTEPLECPRCGGVVTSELTDTTFPYGGGSHIVELPVQLNVYTCAGCGGRFLDDTAQKAKDEAVRRWLGSNPDPPRSSTP
jgi:YgiT-type zinc finger domain-containing protein